MKIFKKSVCAVLLIALTVCILLTGCGTTNYSVTFDLNYDGAPAATVVSVAEGNRVITPSSPEREGYIFNGWFTDKTCSTEAPLSRVVSANATYYAGWEKTGAKVTFDLNYEGSENTSQIVELGEKVSRPQNPTREGKYLFLGWYTAKTCDCTDEEAHNFDFDSTITESVTVYARWQEVEGEIVSVTYNWNYEGAPNNGVCEVYQMEKNSRFPGKVNPVTGIEREGYYLVGWYTEATCQEDKAVVWRNKVTDNTTIYAKWLKVNTFEAEYVDVTDLKGFGFSGNADGVNMISDGKQEFASNGYYLGWLYNPQLQVNFEIDVTEDVTNAWLLLRLSAEFADITLTSSTFTVQIDGTKNAQGKYENGKYIAYKNIEFTNVPSVSSDSRRPFQNYTLTTNLSLTKGKHVITLTINNTERPLGDQGTIYAAAPMIDTLYIYTESTVINWAEGFPMTDNLIGR